MRTNVSTTSHRLGSSPSTNGTGNQPAGFLSISKLPHATECFVESSALREHIRNREREREREREEREKEREKDRQTDKERQWGREKRVM